MVAYARDIRFADEALGNPIGDDFERDGRQGDLLQIYSLFIISSRLQSVASFTIAFEPADDVHPHAHVVAWMGLDAVRFSGKAHQHGVHLS